MSRPWWDSECDEYWRRALDSERERRDLRRLKRWALLVVLLALLVIVGAAQVPMTEWLAVGLKVLEGLALAAGTVLVWLGFRVAHDAARARREEGHVTEGTRRRIGR